MPLIHARSAQRARQRQRSRSLGVTRNTAKVDCLVERAAYISPEALFQQATGALQQEERRCSDCAPSGAQTETSNSESQLGARVLQS